jgi:hypothetical protein
MLESGTIEFWLGKATGQRLTLKTVVSYVDADGHWDVYLKGKEPTTKPTMVPDVIDSRVKGWKFLKNFHYCIILCT